MEMQNEGIRVWVDLERGDDPALPVMIQLLFLPLPVQGGFKKGQKACLFHLEGVSVSSRRYKEGEKSADPGIDPLGRTCQKGGRGETVSELQKCIYLFI